MAATIRRVVTTHDAAGTAVVLSDGTVPLPAFGDAGNVAGAVAWTTEAVPADNVGDVEGERRPAGVTIRGGSVFRVTEFGPGFTSPMHRTHSIDYCVVLQGELEMVLDGGAVTTLRAGDVAVQRGTSHRWRNPSATETCRIVVCMIEAEPVEVNGRILPQDL